MAKFDPTATEVWYPIPGFELYEISSHLRARSYHLGPHRSRRHRIPILIKTFVDDRGYHKLILWKDQRYHNLYLHRVVAELEFGPPPDGMVCRHLNDDKGNNWPSNLAYGTQTQNVADAKRNGTFRAARGEESGNSKLTDDVVRGIVTLAKCGVSRTILEDAFNLKRTYVKTLMRGERWGHVEHES